MDTVAEVVERMRTIDAELDPADGVAVFNRLYLTVTERVGAAVEAGGVFRDPEFMVDLDVSFAKLYLNAHDAIADGRKAPPAWRPLFEDRSRSGLLPVQFAFAGMNTHIEHDLPLAVVATCVKRDRSPGDDTVHADYEAINRLLADVEAGLRRSFLDECQRDVDDRLGPVSHLITSWKIDKARDVAWVSAQTLWSVRRVGVLAEAFRDSLAHTVGMASRILLTPCLL